MCVVLAGGLLPRCGPDAALLSRGSTPGQIVDEQSKLGLVELTLTNFVNMPMLWGGVLASGPFGTTGVFDVGFPYVVGFLAVAAV